jgi:hypothetical protein
VSDATSRGSRLVCLRLCSGFTRREWSLPVPTALTRLLIGWRTVPSPVDAGVPAVVAEVLTTALCRHAMLTFPTERGRDVTWKSTGDPREAAAGIFEGGHFSWDLQGQVVVLSRPGLAPVLNEAHLEVSARPPLFDDLKALGAVGLLLPGVDGDVAGLYTFAPADMHDIIGTLSVLARQAGGDCVSLSEAQFMAPAPP